MNALPSHNNASAFRGFLSLLCVVGLKASSRAQLVIDDFATGPYDFATSPYNAYYNGLTHSRFYFQSGANILGSNRMVVVISNPGFPTNDQFAGSIGGGMAIGQNTPGHALGWEYDYGLVQGPGGPGSFPWQWANLNADLSGYDTIRLSFASCSGNLDLHIGINSPSSYFPTLDFSVPNSSKPFNFDVPIKNWTRFAELSDVNQIDFNFQPGAGGGAGLNRIEALNVNAVPEPSTICSYAVSFEMAGVGLIVRRRRRPEK